MKAHTHTHTHTCTHTHTHHTHTHTHTHPQKSEVLGSSQVGEDLLSMVCSIATWSKGLKKFNR